MKKNMWAKIFAVIALIGIIIWIIWTGILFIYESNTSYPEQIQLTPEEIQEIIDAQESSSIELPDESWILDVLDGAEATSEQEIEEINIETAEIPEES